jgi:hypothetical protein
MPKPIATFRFVSWPSASVRPASAFDLSLQTRLDMPDFSATFEAYEAAGANRRISATLHDDSIQRGIRCAHLVEWFLLARHADNGGVAAILCRRLFDALQFVWVGTARKTGGHRVCTAPWCGQAGHCRGTSWSVAV